MIIERAKPDAFCVTELVWRHDDGAEAVVTEAYVGPEEYSSAGPFFGWSYDWALYRADRLTLVVRRWKTRSGHPDTDAEREYESLTTYVSDDRGRTWRELHQQSLGVCVASSR